MNAQGTADGVVVARYLAVNLPHIKTKNGGRAQSDFVFDVNVKPHDFKAHAQAQPVIDVDGQCRLRGHRLHADVINAGSAHPVLGIGVA